MIEGEIDSDATFASICTEGLSANWPTEEEEV